LRLHGSAAWSDRILHRFADAPISDVEILRGMREHGNLKRWAAYFPIV
jgi:hypothetical protein